LFELGFIDLFDQPIILRRALGQILKDEFAIAPVVGRVQIAPGFPVFAASLAGQLRAAPDAGGIERYQIDITKLDGIVLLTGRAIIRKRKDLFISSLLYFGQTGL
jgi:hypothetical protein